MLWQEWLYFVSLDLLLFFPVILCYTINVWHERPGVELTSVRTRRQRLVLMHVSLLCLRSRRCLPILMHGRWNDSDMIRMTIFICLPADAVLELCRLREHYTTERV